MCSSDLQELFFSPITPVVTLVQDLLFHRALDSEDSDFFWELRVPVIVKMGSYVSLVPVYKLKHDELYRPEFIRSMPRKKEDSTVNVNLQVSF